MEKIQEYILSKFEESDLSPPESYIFSKYHLRFELGDNLKNGTKKRVKQSVLRAVTIFEEFFKPDNEIWILINSWKSRSSAIKEFWRPTKGYLESQFTDFELINKICYEETIEEYDEALLAVSTIKILSKAKPILRWDLIHQLAKVYILLIHGIMSLFTCTMTEAAFYSLVTATH